MAGTDDPKAAQDARIKAATKERAEADKAETERQAAIWARRPGK